MTAPAHQRPHGAKYVVVTGAIAAGASTLSEALIGKYGWGALLEGQVAVDNAFFERAYSDSSRWILASQLHFLTSSVTRHQKLAAKLATGGPDEVILEDRTPFEHMAGYTETYRRLGRIPTDEAALLDHAAEVIEQHYLVPDLLVYREMQHDQLLGRVQERGREGEGNADIELLEGVRQSFDRMVESWDRCEVLVVPSTINVKDPEQFRPLADEIYGRLFPSRHGG